MPWLTQLFKSRPDNLVVARRSSDVNALMRSNERFSDIIVARETSFSHDHVLEAAALGERLICFPQDDGWQVEQAVEFYYPGSRNWSLDSTFGKIFIAEVRGASWRVIYG